MKAKDLMLNNMIYWNGLVGTVGSLHVDGTIGFISSQKHSTIHMTLAPEDEVQGIEITQDLLIKAGCTPKPLKEGFYELNMQGHALQKVTILKWDSPKWAVGIADYAGDVKKESVVKVLDYVHELQNFFYLFTKREIFQEYLYPQEVQKQA
jgi:hypothetical protein